MLLTPFTAYSETEKLGLNVAIVTKDCPFTVKDLHRQIEGEYLRARIKVEDDADTFLSVKVRCLEVKSGATKSGYAVNSNIMFGFGGDENTPELLLADDHGTMSIGGTGPEATQFFLNTIRDGASDALTDFLRYTL